MDICLYMGQDFGFISFPDQLTTGSSIMPHKKNPDVFELIRGKSALLQALPNTLTLLTNNLPSGYHREYQLLKEVLFPAIANLKSCLDMMRFGLKDIIVNPGITDQSKYDYLFSVDALNEKVLQGMPFRDAYKSLGAEIAQGTYVPKRDINHTHIGSIGAPGFEQIKTKMQQASDWSNN